MSYIFEVNHSELLNCVVRVRKREESRMASGVCFFVCLLEQLAGWLDHLLCGERDLELKVNIYFCCTSL